MLPYCCSCNSVNSKGRGCASVKAKRRCTNCRPGLLDFCPNCALTCETSLPGGIGGLPASCPPVIQTTTAQELAFDAERTPCPSQREPTILSSSTSNQSAGTTTDGANLAKELRSSCPVVFSSQFEPCHLSSSFSSSTQDAIAESSSATADFTPRHSDSNLRLIERGADTAASMNSYFVVTSD